jgi:hypothetical protein
MVISSLHHRPSAGETMMPYPRAVIKPWIGMLGACRRLRGKGTA